MSTQTVLTQSIYQGTVVSASVPWVQGATSATVRALMSDSDAQNSGNQMTLYVAASFDAQGTTWTRETGEGWQGGPNGGNTPPAIQWNPGTPPTFVRVEADIANPLSVGFTLDVA